MVQLKFKASLKENISYFDSFRKTQESIVLKSQKNMVQNETLDKTVYLSAEALSL